MLNEYYVKVPSAFFHESPSASSSVTDELLFGTRIFSISDAAEPTEDEWLYCETLYGYRGFIRKKHIARKIGAQSLSVYTVTSAFCDVLFVPEYKYRPFMTLSRGSEVEKNTDFGSVSGFTDVSLSVKKFFVRSDSIRQSTELKQKQPESIKRKNIVDTALSYLGTPYRWGGKSSSGIDCSGLCFQAYQMNGIGLWRDAVPDGNYVRQIRFDELREADLVYYKGHVVMYIGGGEYIHSSATLGGVTVNSFDENSAVYYEKLSHGIIMCARSVEFDA